MYLGVRDFCDIENEIKKGKFQISRFINSNNINEIMHVMRKRGYKVFLAGRIIYNLEVYPNATLLDFTNSSI